MGDFALMSPAEMKLSIRVQQIRLSSVYHINNSWGLKRLIDYASSQNKITINKKYPQFREVIYL